MSPIILACIGIFIGEFYGNFIGGGSIVTQFFLQNLAGIEIKQAIALDNAAVLGSEIGLLAMLLRKQKPQWHHVPFILAVFIGSYLGAQLLHVISVHYLKIIFVIILFAVVLKSFLLESKEPKGDEKFSKSKMAGLIAFGLFVGTYNAFLSIGDFILGLMGLMFFFHFSYLRALFWLSLALVFGRAFATYEYFGFGYIDTDFWIPMIISATISGTIAGYLVDKVDTEKLKPVFKILGLGLACYLSWSLIGEFFQRA